MEGWLGETPLTAMKFTFARQESLAQQTLRTLQRETLYEVVIICDQDIFDVVGMVQEKRFLWPQFEIGDITILRGQVLKERQRPATVSKQA